jgi:flagellin
MVIQHNLAAMNSDRQFGITTGRQAKSAEKLSSGYRINRAADDAAGLAISEKMRRQIRGLTQAEDNVQDGISYVQIADGALAEIDDILARMTELCVKAATESLTDEDRTYINQEIQQLKMESNRTFHTTTFNDRKIWDEQSEDRKVIGKETRPVFTWNNGTSYYNGTITETNKGAWPANGQINFAASANSIKVKWTGYDGVQYESNAIPMPSLDDIKKNGLDLSLNSSTMDYSKYPSAEGITPRLQLTIDEDATMDDVVTALNGNGIYASTSYNLTGNIYSSMSNPRISINSGSMTYLGGLVSGRSINSGSDTGHIAGTSDNKSPAGDTAGTMSFSFTMTKDEDTVPSTPDTFSATAVNNVSVWTNAPDYRDEARGLWWEYNNRGGKYLISHSFSGSGLADSIQKALDDETSSIIDDSEVGGDLYISFNINPDSAVGYSFTGDDGTTTGSQLGNGFASFTLRVSVNSQESGQDVVDRINSITGMDLATSGGGNVRMRNYESQEFEGNIYGGTMKLVIQAGADGTEDNRIPIIYDILNNTSLKINDLNTLTVENASKGLTKVKNAAAVVDAQRALFGAYQNRLEHTYNNLGNVVENTQQAESIIRDTDMAEEMVRYSNNNILAQAGQSMLAQANQTNQGVLSLLQ